MLMNRRIAAALKAFYCLVFLTGL